MAAKPFPILFITASRIGDAVLSSGLVKTLVDEVPDARFTIVGSDLTAPLFAHVPGLEDLIALEKKPGGGHWLELWRRVQARHWGLVVDVRGSPISGLLRRSRRAVHKPAAPAVHKVVEAARMLKMEKAPPWPFLFTTPQIEHRAESLTAGRRPILAMAPGANWIGKAWPPERFALAARQLLGLGGLLAGGRLLTMGGPGDLAVAEPLKSAVGVTRRMDLVGKESLLVCYAVLKRVDLFVGNDSALMHLAAAAGAPTLGLFGPSDETLYRPWGPRGAAVRGERAFSEFLEIDPKLNHDTRHMTDLSVGAVLAAAQDLLARTALEAERV